MFAKLSAVNTISVELLERFTTLTTGMTTFIAILAFYRSDVSVKVALQWFYIAGIQDGEVG